MQCKTCGGVAHPASGCQYSADWIVCGPCIRAAWEWIKPHVSSKGRRKGKPAFYDHVRSPPPTVGTRVRRDTIGSGTIVAVVSEARVTVTFDAFIGTDLDLIDYPLYDLIIERKDSDNEPSD